MVSIFVQFAVTLLCLLAVVSSLQVLGDVLGIVGTVSILLWLCWELTKYTRRNFLSRYISADERKAIVITGCDSGFGNQLAHRLAARGFFVYACCYSPISYGCRDLIRLKNVKCVQLDITSNESVQEAHRIIADSIRADNKKLIALVNNAGIISCGEIEWGRLIQYQRILDVNVLGLIRITREFLPLVRHHQSRIVNVSSVSQRFCTPAFVPYGVSKSAVHSFTMGLRREMFKWGVKVIEIEPDAYKTPLSSDVQMIRSIEECWHTSDASIQLDYGQKYYTEFQEWVINNLAQARPHPDEVVDAMEVACVTEEPQLHYLCCGPHNRLIIWAFDILPTEWLEFFVRFFIISHRPAGDKELPATNDQLARSSTTCASSNCTGYDCNYAQRGL